MQLLTPVIVITSYNQHWLTSSVPTKNYDDYCHKLEVGNHREYHHYQLVNIQPTIMITHTVFLTRNSNQLLLNQLNQPSNAIVTFRVTTRYSRSSMHSPAGQENDDPL